MGKIELLSEKNIPSHLKELFTKAQTKSISYKDFFKELEVQGIVGFEKALYACQVFGISINQAKTLLIQSEQHSIDNWVNSVVEGLDSVE